jgi:Fanconi anemia group M protein
MIVDVHEPASVVAALEALRVAVERRAIQPGDYLAGPVGVERKTFSDFFASIVQRRLFDQVRRLREAYPLALLLVEGDLAEIAKQKNPAAYWGAFSAVTLQERVPILFARDVGETALALDVIERQFAKGALDYGVRHKPRTRTAAERQRFLLEGLPGVGKASAARLLAHFGSARRVFAATEAELLRVPSLGPKRAGEITAILDLKEERPGRLEV